MKIEYKRNKKKISAQAVVEFNEEKEEDKVWSMKEYFENKTNFTNVDICGECMIIEVDDRDCYDEFLKEYKKAKKICK